MSRRRRRRRPRARALHASRPAAPPARATRAQARGPSRALAAQVDLLGTAPEGHEDVALDAVADHLQPHAIARLVHADDVGEILGLRELAAVDSDDQVTADRQVALVLEVDVRARTDESGLVRRPVLLDAVDQRAAELTHLQPPRELRIERDRTDAQVGVLGPTLRAQLPERMSDGLDRPRESDALAPTAGRLDLRVDADHLAAAVEQRAARVAVVDRGVGLDCVADREVR